MYNLSCLNVFLILFLYPVNCIILPTKQGTLKGKTEISRDGRIFYSFYKIPYAEPPVGDLRFKNPVPTKTWHGVRDATTLPPACSSSRGNGVVFGQEDCLYLNVFTPQVTNHTLLPVMVYIYGGAFMFGDALPDKFGAHYFMDKDIVLITFHYRLGCLGFLSTEDEIIPGNYGLKDAIAVLKWVQDYIEAYGGDKSRVTLLGGSSGAITASLALISPLAEGLIHRVITQSGHPFEIDTTPGIARRSAWKYASFVGCDNENVTTSEDLLACLKTLPAEQLAIHNTKLFYFGYLLPRLPWSPVIESENVPGAFLVDEPRKLLSRKTDIPWIMGMNSDDGSMLAIFTYFNPAVSVAEELEKNYKKYFPSIFHYDHINNTEQLDHLTESYKNYYFADKRIAENVQGFSKMVTNTKYLPGIKEIVKLYKGPKYVYYYNHRNNETFAHTYGEVEEEMGVTHGDELISMYNWSSTVTPVTEGVDLVVSKQIIQFWTNFAAKGDPNENEQFWTPVHSPDINYLHIQNGTFEMKDEFLKSEFELVQCFRAQDYS